LFAGHAALSIALTSASYAAGYPDRAVKVVVPFPAGGVTDIATRVIAQKLSERLGQQFYIENIGGAGGNLDGKRCARSWRWLHHLIRVIEHCGESKLVQANSI
jgi:tripartite-type tricarboxylate transporter receptor subunit TctC